MVVPERVCYLCGVSFDIRRCRTADEPESERFGDPVYCVPFHCGHDAPSHRRLPSDPVPYGTRFLQRREHVALKNGPEFLDAYNGYKIDKEEMVGVDEVVCIRVKPTITPSSGVEGLYSDSTAEEIDAQTITFVSGTGRMQLFNVVNISPRRYGIAETTASTSGATDPGPGNALPIHSWCFEIFCRISTQKLGKVDIDGLYRHSRTRANDSGPVMRRGKDVRHCQGRKLEHGEGTEYLAANPLRISPSIANTVAQYVNKPCTPRAIFDVGMALSHDCFSNLPTELRDEIPLLLPKQSVANLRSSSRSCTALPQLYFRHLVENEMPWLWELSSSYTRSQKTGTDSSVDWFGLYTAIRRLLRDIKGLQNRARIWRDVGWIVESVKDLNAELGDHWDEEWLAEPRTTWPVGVGTFGGVMMAGIGTGSSRSIWGGVSSGLRSYVS